jgi:methylmalonyl-CoA mutase N-terminal domain/subunit
MLLIGPAVEEIQRARVAAVRLARDQNAVDQALADLEAGASGTDNLMPLLVEAARRRVTEGEMVATLKSVFGTYREPARF